MNDAKDLAVALKSRFPIILIETHEEQRVLALLENLTNLAGRPCSPGQSLPAFAA